jgi:hypothetical protein
MMQSTLEHLSANHANHTKDWIHRMFLLSRE